MKFKPGSQVMCINTERDAWLKVGDIYIVAEPIPGYHENAQVLEPDTGRRIDMSWGSFKLVKENPGIPVKDILDAELQRRLWAVFDAAKAICEGETPKLWAELYQAVANVPESQRPKS